MPADRTEVTEIVTGLATFGRPDLDTALADPPAAFGGVGDDRWSRLRLLAGEGRLRAEFAAAWANGTCFLRARDGLRDRPPQVVEWKGPQRPPGVDPLPADLRIDHVYLVSCKYNSRITLNVSPRSIFAAPGDPGTGDWFGEVAPDATQALYDIVRFETGLVGALPDRVGALSPAQRRQLAVALGRGRWTSPAAAEAYRALSGAVAAGSARRWRDRLHRREREQEATLWRFLRVAAATYFVLGSDGTRMVRMRVGSPWDWRQSFRLRRFDVAPAATRQPVVTWAATVEDREAGEERTVEGHVEIRWSHGRFAGPPEAKVYLDTPHHQVPGYWPLT